MYKIILLFVTFFFFLSCSDTKETATHDEKSEEAKRVSQQLSVQTTKIDSAIFQKQTMSNGVVEALQKSELRFKISERVASIHVKNGGFVTKGQVLATLDNAMLENLLERATIDLDKAKRNFIEEKINYGFGGIDESKIEPKKLKNIYLRSGYTEAKNALDNAQIQYNQTLLKAPFSGVVANLESKVGDFVTSGDIFCIIINRKQLEVSFAVLENEIPFLETNQKITVTSFIDEKMHYEGIITEINPLVDRNGLVKIKGSIQKPTASLFDGMHVKIRINKPLTDVLVIPREAVVFREDREVVFTAENGKAKWNYIEILDENSKSYALQKGLKYGDTIIVTGNMNLSHDAKISPTFQVHKEENLHE
ncbi:efflux RND transporter periplasmic adaptor subunit [Kordia sp. YSTF-M3]|uniref:Efflux RND transporter periplasmic adaptor subunit n=1 Tax=Kordia aestuariivivens TaxID=2759037 RepID=A0ABR7Q7J4_9FLAO|nr:efflux RND transporter periplasmic adaptor subunit [Kordia aestuariivivens]MBC8754294.1 efflux RND transporter periplasmic adaptor subunit [Kordia aestuariivivens]